MVQVDTTWGPNGFVAWTSWGFPLVGGVIGLLLHGGLQIVNAIQKGEFESVTNAVIILTMLIATIIFGLFLFLVALGRTIDGWWVARKLIRNGGKVKVVRYFFPPLEIYVDDVACIERFSQSKIRQYMTLLYLHNRKKTKENFCVKLKDGRQFWLNGDMFDPYTLFS